MCSYIGRNSLKWRHLNCASKSYFPRAEDHTVLDLDYTHNTHANERKHITTIRISVMFENVSCIIILQPHCLALCMYIISVHIYMHGF